MAVPPRFHPVVLQAARLGEQEGKPLSRMVWEALEEHLRQKESEEARTLVAEARRVARGLAKASPIERQAVFAAARRRIRESVGRARLLPTVEDAAAGD